MSLFTRSFRRETKRLLQYRPSILGPSLETFKINFKSFLYSFHIPSISSFFFFFFIMKLPWRGKPGQAGAGWAGEGGSEGRGWSICCPGRVTPVPAALHTGPAAPRLLPACPRCAEPACCLADISLCLCSLRCSNNPPQGQIRFIWKEKAARGFRMTMLIRNQNINSNSTWMY